MAYIDDNLVKYRCFNCHREFIVSEYQVKEWQTYTLGTPHCPFCEYSSCTEAIVWMDDENMLDMMGCMGMGHEEGGEQE